jgi:hypothetical protein
MECGVVDEDVECLFLFENVHTDVHIDHISEICPSRLLGTSSLKWLTLFMSIKLLFC